MARKQLILIAVLIMSGIVLFFCLPKSDYEKLKKIIYKTRSSFQKEDIAGSLKYVSVNYQDDNGFDRRALLYIAKEIFQNYDTISLYINDLDIDIASSEAEADIRVLVTAKSIQSNELSFDQDLFHLIVTFSKEEGKWFVKKLKFLEPESLNLNLY